MVILQRNKTKGNKNAIQKKERKKKQVSFKVRLNKVNGGELI